MFRSGASRTLWILVACVLLAGAQMAIAPVGAQPATVDGHSGQSNLVEQVAQQSTPANNTTPIRHRNPETVNEEGNLGSVESYLSTRLSQRLGDSAVELEQGEYDRAQSLLGDDYDDSLQQYVDVAGETGNEDTAETLEEATEQQRTFINETQQYRETREEYEQAKREGDEDRARRLARQLERQAGNVSQHGQALSETYDGVENATSADLDEGQVVIENETRTVEQQQAEIRQAEFIETRLQLTTKKRAISFLDPLTLNGSIETVDGEPLPNRTVTLQIGENRRRVTTNGSGAFTLRYRPRAIPLTETELRVAYRPTETAPYLGSQTSVPIIVDRQITATIRLEQIPDRTAYGEQVTVTGTVKAAGVPVSTIPVGVQLDQRRLGTVTTNESGQFRVETRLPAEIPAGERQLTAVHPQTDRAVGANATATTVVIESTATTLSITAEPNAAGEIRVTGQLQTVDGTPVAEQPVAIQTLGTTRAIVDTNATGWYQATIPVGGNPGDVLTVEAQFERPATNLESAEARTQLNVALGRC